MTVRHSVDGVGGGSRLSSKWVVAVRARSSGIVSAGLNEFV